MAPRHALFFLVLVPSGASAFQVRPEVRKLRNAFYSSSVAMSLSKDTGDEKNPFFARALEKLRKSKKEDSDHPVLGKHENEDTIGDSEAATLRALSEKTRLEAEKMDMLLTLKKIDKLEDKLADKDDHPDLLRNTQILMKKFAPLALENTTTETPISTDGGDSNPSNNHQETSKNKVKEILDGDKPLLSDDMREDAIEAFEMLPEPLKDMMARTAGMKDGSNASATIDMLMAENRLFEGDDEQKFSMIAKTEDLMEDIILDPDFVEINNFIRKLLPATTRKEPVKQEYIDALYSEVFGKDTFNPKERKPEAVPGGYLVRGVSKVRPKKEEDDGDVLIQALDRKISESSLAGKIQVYYILDPTPPSGEEIMNDEGESISISSSHESDDLVQGATGDQRDCAAPSSSPSDAIFGSSSASTSAKDETPVLLITGYDISPDTQVWVKPTITLLGLVSIAAFALGSTILNPAVQQTLATGSEVSGSLYELSLPLALYLLMLQAVVFVGHLFVSVKDGIQIGLPTLVPSFQLGLTGSITPIKTSPKNIKSLFDFAITGTHSFELFQY